MRFYKFWYFLLIIPLFGNSIQAQSILPIHIRQLEYRMIGPFRAGRTVGAVGVPSQPNLFFIGVNNGGVWKTDDYGRTWLPIFDKMPTGSIGDIAVSPTKPQIIYVGTGEGLHRPDLSIGNGIYKSEDGGTTWNHLGLKDTTPLAPPPPTWRSALPHAHTPPGCPRHWHSLTSEASSWRSPRALLPLLPLPPH